MTRYPIVAALLALTIVSCVSGGGGDGEPPATPTGSPPTGRLEATPLPVGGRVTFYAADANDRAASLAAGDFNGDGDLDVLFAAAFAAGPDNERPEAGEAYVFLGPFEPGESGDAAAGDQALTLFGADPGDQTGRSAAAGDVNGDGIDDIVLGAPFGDGPDGGRPDAGEVAIVFGSAAIGGEVRERDLRDGADLILYGEREEDLAGFDVALGDLDGDGLADLVAGAFWADGPGDERPEAGEVYAVFGSSGAGGSVDVAAGEQDVTVYGAVSRDRLGESVAAGDVNGDGRDDLVLPAPFASSLAGEAEAGRTYVMHSPPAATIDLAQSVPDTTIYGIDNGDQFGHSIALADVSGDAAADILLGAVSADGEGNESNLAGEAAIVPSQSLGGNVDLAKGGATLIVYGADGEDRLGRAVALGDIDGDRRGELLLGSPDADGEGAASPYAGEVSVVRLEEAAGDSTLQLPSLSLVLTGDDAGDALTLGVYGRRALLLADVDADGAQEILVSAPFGDGPGESRPDCGEAYVVFTAGR